MKGFLHNYRLDWAWMTEQKMERAFKNKEQEAILRFDEKTTVNWLDMCSKS